MMGAFRREKGAIPLKLDGIVANRRLVPLVISSMFVDFIVKPVKAEPSEICADALNQFLAVAIDVSVISLQERRVCGVMK